MSRFVVMVVFVLLMSLLLKSKFVLFDELWTLKTAFKPLVVVLSIALETAMLVFLYSTKSRKTKLLSILVLFLSYSAISVYSLLSETSCSCFGALDVSPLYMLLLNGLIASFASYLLLSERTPGGNNYMRLDSQNATRAITVFIAVFIGTYVSSKAGVRESTSQMPLLVQQTEDVKICLGKEASVVFKVSNPNRFPLRIVGHKLSCSCLRDINYPTVVNSRGYATIHLQFAGEITGPINKHFRLFFSGVGLNVVSVSIKGQVMPPEST